MYTYFVYGLWVSLNADWNGEFTLCIQQQVRQCSKLKANVVLYHTLDVQSEPERIQNIA